MELDSIKLEYIRAELNIEDLNADPMQQLKSWMEEVVKAGVTYPNAAHLASTGMDDYPQTRVVLLKEIVTDGLIFYTNYESPKAQELLINPKACLNLFWKELDRQIRITGSVQKISRDKSEKYFFSRPIESQISAIASPQGQEISKADLYKRVDEVRKNGVNFPENWGGFELIPNSFEFWQGRPNRLHDRFKYKKNDKEWTIVRLAP